MGNRVSGTSTFAVSLLACLSLALLAAPEIHSQTEQAAAPVKPSVLIAALPLQGAPDEGLRRVLASVMRFQLERSGTQTLLFSGTTEQDLVDDLLGDQAHTARTLTEALLEFFRADNHDFLLLGGYIYIKEGEEIQVEFYIADLERAEVLASASRRARIDFDLDEVMIRALREMLPAAAGRIEEVARRKAVAAQAAEASRLPATERVMAETQAEKQPGEETREQKPSGEKGVAVQPEPAVVVAGEREARFRPLEFSLGFAPFIPVGMANDVFALSYVPFAYWNYRIPLSAGILGLGLYTAVNIFDAEEIGVAAYFHYLIPVGLEVRYSTAERTSLGLFVRACLGAAYNASSFEKLPPVQRENLSRFLAFARGGMGVMYSFSRSVGIAVDVTYETFVYFWKPAAGGGISTDWIMGFVPSVYLYTRL